MRVETFDIDGPLLITPTVHADARGHFQESWNQARFDAAVGRSVTFVQDNQSRSARKGTLRGLHYQAPPMAQAKLVRCGRGAVRDVCVDVRPGSPSYGRHIAVDLTEDNHAQLWVPEGFLHGFITLCDDAVLLYKATAGYSAAHDGAVHYDSLGIDWGADITTLSDRDRAAPAFADWTSPF